MSGTAALSEFVRYSKYAAVVPGTTRRETWEEQVARVFRMHREFFGTFMKNETFASRLRTVEQSVLEKRILGSQRALQFAGPSLLKNHARMYNCVGGPIDRVRAFQEVAAWLLCGSGVGFGVSRVHVNKLPPIHRPNYSQVVVHRVEDSIEGFADAFGCVLSSYFSADCPFPGSKGKRVVFDWENVRAKGTSINGISGKAPGPGPTRQAIAKIEALLERVLGDKTEVKLRPIHVYDILMHISDSIISGGVRRSATIALFDLDDAEMVSAKTGNWFSENPQRARSNNSVVLDRKKTTLQDFQKIIESTKQFGEPGFIWSDDPSVFYNPCGEICFYPYDDEGNSGWQCCNLCEINMRQVTSEADFITACQDAAFLGTLQAAYTDFPYWGRVTESIVRREALIGVSMTGMADNPKFAFDTALQRLGAACVMETNKSWSKFLGINAAARTTCVKPAGCTSCLLETASGIHPHYASRYFRRVQCSKNDPVYEFYAKNSPLSVENSVWNTTQEDGIVTFCCEAPPGALTGKKGYSALRQLELVKATQQNWVTKGRDIDRCSKIFLNNNVSNTITVQASEWEDVAKYIYEFRDSFAGVSLLSSFGDKDYEQAPFQEVLDNQQLTLRYGSAAIFVSGFMKALGQDVFATVGEACSYLLHTNNDEEEKQLASLKTNLQISIADSVLEEIKKKTNRLLALKRAQRFANEYLNGDIKEFVYCIKDVDAWQKWCQMSKQPSVDWSRFQALEPEDIHARANASQGCAKGMCDLTDLR